MMIEAKARTSRTPRHHTRWLHQPLALALFSVLANAPGGFCSSLQGKTVLLPVGTTMEGRVNAKISSSSSHQGDRFMIEMAAPVLINGSEVVIPAGSQIVGEVVEAIPSDHLPHKKKTPKPYGKLRVQLSGLRLPDGASYPLVASLAPESYETGQGRSQANQNLGGGVGYVGSDSAFENASSGISRSGGRGSAPKIMGKRDLQRDPLLGRDSQNTTNGSPRIRALKIKGHDIYIENGSPVSVKLDAPLRLSLGQALSPSIQSQDDRPLRSEGRRFGSAPDQAPPDSSGPFTPGTLPFLRGNQAASPKSPQPPGPQSTPPPGHGTNRLPTQSGGSSDF